MKIEEPPVHKYQNKIDHISKLVNIIIFFIKVLKLLVTIWSTVKTSKNRYFKNRLG